jgi:hypothetical protein
VGWGIVNLHPLIVNLQAVIVNSAYAVIELKKAELVAHLLG